MPHRRGNSPSEEPAAVERLVAVLGAANEIAPFDDAASGKKVGELIARGATARKRKKTTD